MHYRFGGCANIYKYDVINLLMKSDSGLFTSIAKEECRAEIY
jgi:hypothetical protein